MNALATDGVDCLSTQAANRRGATDAENLAWCRVEGRTIVTADDDYLRLHAASVPHAGIIYCVRLPAGVGVLARGLGAIHRDYSRERLAGA